MTKDSPRTLFLARRSYRQRRLRDMLRVLPICAAVLWLIPLLWASGDTSVSQTSHVSIYVFTVWVVMICLAALFSSRAKVEDDPDSPEDTGR